MIPQKTYKPRLKKCKQCGKSFRPYNPLQIVCELNCAVEYNRKKKIEDQLKTFKKNLKNHSYYIKLLQSVFNTYIRIRDKNHECICCNKPLGQKYHAGHFWSTGAFPALRFDEDNVHAQREDCNLHKHGNHAEYSIRLPLRIGEKRYNDLFNRRNNVCKLSIQEIEEKIKYYKERTKNL